MGLVIALLVLAFIAGGLGLVIKGAVWLLIIAVVLLVASAVVGFTRGRVGGPRV